MIKFIFFILFLTPLCFFSRFWVVQLIFLLVRFLFILNLGFNFQFIGISYLFGVDLLSYTLILLRFWICALIILAREKVYKIKNYFNLFLINLLILLISLVITFCAINLFIFYLFFEISLIPTLILIIGWGYQPERIQAGIYLLFYTLLASLPIIIVIFYYYRKFGSLDFIFINNNLNRVYIYICINIVFFIKIPMFFVHLWLPKAHVEAPVAGSIILAGIILKLGGYGLLRFIPLFIEVGLKINFLFVNISLVGGLIVSLICIRQSDIKSLIAYSSVAHIGIVLGGIIRFNYWGLSGALVIILAHGLCSSGLFALANISYERLISRRLYLNKGLINLIPSIRIWWFLLCSSNIAAPPSLNLLGEIILINRLISYRVLTIIFLIFISFFRAVYSLYLYSYTQHGIIYSGVYSLSQNYTREFLLIFLHWFPLNIIILKRENFTLWIYLSSLSNKTLICGVKNICIYLKFCLFVIFIFYCFCCLEFLLLWWVYYFFI